MSSGPVTKRCTPIPVKIAVSPAPFQPVEEDARSTLVTTPTAPATPSATPHHRRKDIECSTRNKRRLRFSSNFAEPPETAAGDSPDVLRCRGNGGGREPTPTVPPQSTVIAVTRPSANTRSRRSRGQAPQVHRLTSPADYCAPISPATPPPAPPSQISEAAVAANASHLQILRTFYSLCIKGRRISLFPLCIHPSTSPRQFRILLCSPSPFLLRLHMSSSDLVSVLRPDFSIQCGTICPLYISFLLNLSK